MSKTNPSQNSIRVQIKQLRECLTKLVHVEKVLSHKILVLERILAQP